MALGDAKDWFIFALCSAVELKSDLRIYKFEKKFARVGNSDDEHGERRNILNVASSRFVYFNTLLLKYCGKTWCRQTASTIFHDRN